MVYLYASRLLPFFVISAVLGFQTSFTTRQRRSPPSSTRQFLVPISKFRDDITFLSKPEQRLCFSTEGKLEGNEEYVLGLMEDSDLPDVAQFVVESFGSDAIALSTDLSRIEQILLKPPADLLNAYSGAVALAEVISGIQNRCSDKLANPTLDLPPIFQDETSSPEEKLTVAQRNSVVLVLTKPSKSGNNWRTDVIATVELRLQVSSR
mmetsp:Transcript_19236/g.28470  ORF Transcript_19236/g.28470 Transcript_19236/m.28470 type:complete len:208 (-) Transcript_19236:557-1180(-)